MTELILRGSHALTEAAADAVCRTIDRCGADHEVGFPGTAYVCPVLYALSGIKVRAVRHLSECLQALRFSLSGQEKAETLRDATVRAAAAAEVLDLLSPGEADRSAVFSDEDARMLGVRIVSGEVPGLAVLCGTAPENAVHRCVETCREAGMAVLLCGKEISASYSTKDPMVLHTDSLAKVLSLILRIVLIFRDVPGGQVSELLKEAEQCVPGFIHIFGERDESAVALAAFTAEAGFTVTLDASVSGEELPDRFSAVPEGADPVFWSMEKRGICAKPKPICLPVGFDSAFEGEILREGETAIRFSSTVSAVCELVSQTEPDTLTDGEIRVIGPELTEVAEKMSDCVLALSVEVAGHRMQSDFEPVLERQMTRWLNYVCGVTHTGQRDRVELRVSRNALQQGLSLFGLGRMLHTMFRTEFASVAEKCRITFYTDPKEAKAFLIRTAQPRYAARDARMADLTDEHVTEFYRCTMCQSIAPNHCCIVTPERPGLCGAVNWLDAKASYELNPIGPDRPVICGTPMDARLGQYEAVNTAVAEASHGTVSAVSLYSFVRDPMTSCSRFECICALEPLSSGAVLVDRDYEGSTPTGMPAEDLAAMVRGGEQTPGLMGHSLAYLLSPKYIAADGGILRIVWMNSRLKQQVGEALDLLAEERFGIRDFVGRIADETVTNDPEELLAFLIEREHPVLGLKTLM